MMATFLGEHSRATQAYHCKVVNKLTYIMQQINMTYVEPMIQKEIFVKIMVFIVCETDCYLMQLMHPPPGGQQAIRLPKYEEILEYLSKGRV